MATKRVRILVADDERTMLELFRETLGPDCDVRLAGDGDEAARLLESEQFDLAFLDLRMPGQDGGELLRGIRKAGRAVRTVLMSAHAGEGRRAELLSAGADRFLEKPVFPHTIESTIEELLTTVPAVDEDTQLVARDARMRDVLTMIDRVAPTRATVLLQGETGTGKELLAREIHRRSNRAGRPFVRVNCAALAEGILESELFGHERGAFTGAIRTTRGLFHAADGGTLLLDEISEVSAALQAKLLRVLQEREIRRVGAVDSVAVDARIVATTNRDLAAEVSGGRFRADLYHRLNVVRIEVPPLRTRREDVAALAEAILDRKAEEHDLPRPRLTAAARARLESHVWPGNVRELENVLESALLLTPDAERLEPDALRIEAAGPNGTVERVRVGMTIREAERILLLETLHAAHGNRTRAAQVLGISVRTMRNKLTEYRRAGHFPEEGSS